MKTLVKIALSLVGLFVLILVSSVLFILLVDPNNHKDWIENQVRENSGYELELAGDIEFSLYPWLRIAVADVRIANPSEFAGPDSMLTLESAEFRARLLPMLGRNFEIDTVAVRGLEANFITLADGRSNWAGPESGPAAAAPDTESGGGMPFNDLRLGGVNFEDINIRYEDRATGQSIAVSELRFASDELVYGEPLNAELTFSIAATEPALESDVNLQARVNYDLENEVYSIAPLEISGEIRGDSVPGGSTSLALDSAVNFDLGADSLTAEPISLAVLGTELQAGLTASGLQSERLDIASTVNLRGEDLALLFSVAGIEPLASQLREIADASFTFQGELNAQPLLGGLSIPELQLSLLGADFRGSIEASNLTSDEPLVSGNLTAAGPNLPSVLEVIGQISGGRDSRLAEGGRLMQQIPDKDFSLASEFDVDLAEGNVEVSRLDIQVLGAGIEGDLSASDVNTSEPAVSGRLTAGGPDLPLLMQIGGWFQGGEQSPLFLYGSELGTLSDKAFAVNSGFEANLSSGAITVQELSARAFGIAVDGDFVADDINRSSGRVDGGLTVSGDNLGTLLSALGQSDLAQVARSLAVELQFSGTSNDLSIDPAQFEFVVAGSQIPNSPATLALSAASRVDLEREALQVDSFSVTGLGLDLRGSLSAGNLLSDPELNGGIELARFNPRQLLEQLNQPLPVMADPEALQALSLSTRFDYSPDSISLSELTLLLDETNLNGQFVMRESASPQWQLDLDIDRINLDRYLPPTGAQDEQVSSEDDAMAMAVPTDVIRQLDVRASADIGQLQVAGLALADLSLGVEARAGMVTLSPLRSNLYEGSFNGEMSLDASQEIPAATVNIALQQVNIEPLLLDMMNASYVSGRGSIQLDLRTQGADTLAMQQGLDGQGSINLEDGVLRGVDVGAVLAQLETMIRSRSAGQISRGQQTAFESFSANLNFDDGAIISNDLLIRAPGFDISGQGTLLDLNDETIDYTIRASVDAATATRADQEFDIGGYSLPIACTGTVSAPRCLPDAAQILAAAVANELRDRAGDLLQRALGNDNDPAETDPNEETDSDQQVSPQEELLNRALDRLLPN